MTVPKLRAAIVVLLVGSALGLSVFAASRLFVRSTLGAAAVSAAEAMAERLAAGDEAAAGGALSSVTRYSYRDLDGRVLDSSEPVPDAADPPGLSGGEIAAAHRRAAEGDALVAEAPLGPSLLGLAEPAVRGVAVPVTSGGRTIGTLYAEVDQTREAEALGRTFSLAAMVTLGLAVLATLIVFGLTRLRGGAANRGFLNPRILTHDGLTGLPTREAFKLALADSVKWAKSADRQIGLVMVDLGGIGSVNEVWGPAAGDAVLKAAAERLRGFAETPAALARLSDESFGLIVEQDATSHSLRRIADRIREAMTAPHKVGSAPIVLRTSFGAAVFPVNAENAEVLLRAADTALRQSKSAGRGALVFFDTEMEKRIERRAALERDLKQALDRDEFVVFYQPQLELASGRVRGYEALVRWERPGEGIVTPRDFLEVAEETGLIRQLGEWVLSKACRDAVAWVDSGIVAVNFSPAQFRVQDLPEAISKALAASGLPAERLEVEVPESLFLEHAPEVMDQLDRIKALGVRVAMDNFGAGYSGLASLAQFRFDKIKIDRSFVRQLTEEADVAAIVASVVGLGRSLSLDVTAEGVETDEQVALLRAAGCSIVQGFLFGAPSREARVPVADGEKPGGEDEESASAAAGG